VSYPDDTPTVVVTIHDREELLDPAIRTHLEPFLGADFDEQVIGA
jgi:hypothetical protein